MTIAAVLLAAGTGTRFDGPTHKLLAPWGAGSVFGAALASAASAGLDEVIVVTGAVDLTPVVALAGVDFAIGVGELVAVVGTSGSGKTTLMNILGCLDTPTSGSYRLRGQAVSGLSDDDLSRLRNREIGFVFQNFQLLARADAWRNVELPLVYRDVPRAERRERAAAMLKRVGLGHRMHHRSHELSGGQRQRVALGRALAPAPRALLLDEPLSAVDLPQRRDLLARLRELLSELDIPVIYVTHSEEELRFWACPAIELRARPAPLGGEQVIETVSVT